MKVSDIVYKKIAIHCSTREESDRVLSLISEAGYTWKSGVGVREKDNWKKYKEATCYCLLNGCLQFCFEEYYIRDGMEVISSDKFGGINILHIKYEGK
jgi:hypothetical protein